MQRREAIQVLHGIIKICSENSAFVNSITLVAPSKDTGLIGYQLKIGTTVDDDCRKSLMLLLKEKSLEMEQKEDHIIVFKPD